MDVFFWNGATLGQGFIMLKWVISSKTRENVQSYWHADPCRGECTGKFW